MKKIFLVLIFMFCFVLSSCGKKKEETSVVNPPVEEPETFNQASITYYLCGGVNNNSNVISLSNDDLPYVLSTPKKSKVTFLGWYENADFSGEKVELIDSLTKEHYDLYAKWDDNEVYHQINYVLNGGTLDAKANNQYLEGFKYNLQQATKQYCSFLGWKLDPNDENYVTSLDKSYKNDVTLYACFEELSEFTILYKYDAGTFIKENFTDLDDFKNYFLNELYKYSCSKKDYDKFVSDQLASWKNGESCDVELFLSNGKGEINNKYFFLASGNEEWTTWMDTFSSQVAAFSSYSAWANAETAYKSLASLLEQSDKNWTETRVNKVISAIEKTLWLIEEYSSNEVTTLNKLTISDGRVFDGWYTEDGINMNVIPEGTKGNLTLYARFYSPIPVTSFTLNNKIDSLKKFTSHVLNYTFNPTDASYTALTFTTSDQSVVEVSSSGVLTGLKDGTATITIHVSDNENCDISFEVSVYTVPFIDVTFSNGSIIEIGNTTKLISTCYGFSGDVKYQSLNESIATIDNDGTITGLKEGNANIKITSSIDENVNLTIGLTVIPYSESEFFKIIAEAHNSDIHVQRNVNVAYRYFKDVFCSVSDLLFNYKYFVNTEYEEIQKNVSYNHGGTKSSTEFICVHYTAGYQPTSTGRANAQYFASGGGGTSVHYTTGNDGIFHMLDNSLVGYHAGDGFAKFEWIKTNVKATANVKPEWGVVEDAKSSTGYYFTINGVLTSIEVPTTGVRNSGAAAKLANPLDAFTYFGPAWKVVDGYYYMGTTWACFTQIWDGAICSHGGNNNSIGIETACNEGSDLWYTYQITAQLVAHLMDEYDLDISRVVGHNFFSGKDCPQTLLYNDADLWPHFIECVEAEYDLYENMTKNGDYTISCVSNDPEYLSDNGRIIKVPLETTSVSYTVTVKNNNTGETRTATFSSVIHGKYTE